MNFIEGDIVEFTENYKVSEAIPLGPYDRRSQFLFVDRWNGSYSIVRDLVTKLEWIAPTNFLQLANGEEVIP